MYPCIHVNLIQIKQKLQSMYKSQIILSLKAPGKAELQDSGRGNCRNKWCVGPEVQHIRTRAEKAVRERGEWVPLGDSLTDGATSHTCIRLYTIIRKIKLRLKISHPPFLTLNHHTKSWEKNHKLCPPCSTIISPPGRNVSCLDPTDKVLIRNIGRENYQ